MLGVAYLAHKPETTLDISNPAEDSDLAFQLILLSGFANPAVSPATV
jgi:hypothetical protein